ncbi:C40 family peptidase [Alicyclobacillus mengziensis]|uniref:C40 family peptidase n=1 Tax=Alicyclobacillus mengziensis TaxID=2931921 RepID=A0A9X7VXJ6_9BACL|nr:C40 family peptidase [Alicyclobacillus mengziensis]QSO46931.1 C40 family peptidase [Alicyclobacillus mengziensis]
MNPIQRLTIAGMTAFALLTPTVFAATAHHVVETNHGWVSYHSEAKLSSPVLGRLELGQEAPLIKKADAYWYEIDINGRDVYITTNSNYTHVANVTTLKPAATTAPAPQSIRTTTSTPAPSQDVIHVTAGNGTSAIINLSGDTVQQKALIKTALTQLGVRYWWGHQVPNYAPVNGRDGFDCSNFVAWTYKTSLGIHFSGSSVYQRFHVGTPVTIDKTDKTKYLQPGDLLFFANASEPNGQGHVGMYIGSGLIIQEGGGRGKVTVESLNNHRAWFGRSLVFARRVLK